MSPTKEAGRASAAGSVELGARLRRYRRERGWTQAQLAAKAGLSTHTVSRMERGSVRPLERTAAALAKALGVEAERLLGLDGQPVLFPLPEGPRTARVSPDSTLSETPRRTWSGPEGPS